MDYPSALRKATDIVDEMIGKGYTVAQSMRYDAHHISFTKPEKSQNDWGIGYHKYDLTNQVEKDGAINALAVCLQNPEGDTLGTGYTIEK